MMLLTYRK